MRILARCERAVGFYVACGATASAESIVEDVTGLDDRRVIFTM